MPLQLVDTPSTFIHTIHYTHTTCAKLNEYNHCPNTDAKRYSGGKADRVWRNDATDDYEL